MVGGTELPAAVGLRGARYGERIAGRVAEEGRAAVACHEPEVMAAM